MTPYQRSILESLHRAPVDYMRCGDAAFAALVELGRLGLAEWPVGSPFISITPAGIAAPSADIVWPGLTDKEYWERVSA